GVNSDVLIRRNFPDTAYWNPSVVTGDDGSAKVTLKLPDNLTTWRLTARGLTADTRVGQVASDLVATKPLLKLHADAKQSIQVPANSTAVVRWPTDVAGAGQALLRFSLDGGGLQDHVEQTLPIQRFTTLETVASAGQVQDTTVETI